MKPTETLRDRNRLVRTLAALALAVVSLRSLRNGKRVRGVLAGVGAVALGYDASGRSDDVTDALDTDEFDSDVLGSDTTGADTADADTADADTADADTADADTSDPAVGETTDDRMECPVCGEPIVAGERRTPNDDGETVHEACLEATA